MVKPERFRCGQVTGGECDPNAQYIPLQWILIYMKILGGSEQSAYAPDSGRKRGRPRRPAGKIDIYLLTSFFMKISGSHLIATVNRCGSIIILFIQ